MAEENANGKNNRVAVVGESALLTGFKLAGVERLYLASGAADAEAALGALMEDATVGIIVIDEGLLEACDWRLKRKVEAAAKPVVVSVPGKGGPMEQTESLSKLIKRALGFDIMNKKDAKEPEKKKEG
ncbi:MAG: V-type ATP synthase subunit F [Candidatus Micrarchaeota archaeon]